MTSGATLLYGPATARARPWDLPARIERLIRLAGVDAAFDAFAEEAASRVGAIQVDPEIEVAAGLIASAQVKATYEGDPAYTGNRYEENRPAEEAELVRRQTTYVVLAGISGNEAPGDPRIHLYRWAERPEVLWVSPIARTLLPLGVPGRDVGGWFGSLPAEHRRIMDELYAGEGSNLVGEIHGQLTDLLIDGDKGGFCGLKRRLHMAQEALVGHSGTLAPLLDHEREGLGRSLTQAFHPLPGSWLGLRTQVAQATRVKTEIRRHLVSVSERREIAKTKAATDQDWEEIAVACLAYYDVQAEEELQCIARRISRAC